MERMTVELGEKTYTLEYTRDSIVKAEEAFNMSMLKREEPKSVKELVTLLKALLYAALVKHHKDITPAQMEAVYEEFVGENGYEQEGLAEGLMTMMVEVLNPTGGGRKKKLRA